ncbi:MAG: FAD-dependent oxidoreductase [Ilumatobacteraceae bacterium]
MVPDRWARIVAGGLRGVAERAGVDLRTATEVVRIERTGDGAGQVRAVVLASGEELPADLVVVNADAEHLFADLLPDPKRLRRVRRAGRSTSGFVVLVGAEGTTPGLAHHNVWFGPDERVEFTTMHEDGRFAEHPTVYGCVSSVTDPSQAPDGCENWFLLVNAPAAPERTPAQYETVVFDELARHGIDLRSRARFVETVAPGDLQARYRAPGGAIYGTSSNGRRAAFLRPGNRGPVRGLYLVGGSSHPGGGLPLVTTSARIVADLVQEDGW